MMSRRSVWDFPWYLVTGFLLWAVLYAALLWFLGGCALGPVHLFGSYKCECLKTAKGIHDTPQDELGDLESLKQKVKVLDGEGG